MLGMPSSLTAAEEADEAYVTCGDSYPDRDGYAAWGNSCGGDADDQ